MIEFKNKIKVKSYMPKSMMPNVLWAKHHKLCHKEYDLYGKCWEVGEDINFNKFWFREIEDKNAELVVKGFRKDD